jgi:uncharacterized membrane protein
MSGSCRRVWLMANFVVAALIVSGMDTAAYADFTVCNHTPVRMKLSFGYNDTSLGWTSAGWFDVLAGNCKVLYHGNLTSSVYYFYAEGEDGSYWGNKPNQQGGGFCTSRNKFKIPAREHSVGNNLNCEAAGFEGRRFVRVDTKGKANFTANLRANPNSSGPTQAQPLPSPPQAQPLPVPTAPPGRPAPSGSACQRYPNLC